MDAEKLKAEAGGRASWEEGKQGRGSEAALGRELGSGCGGLRWQDGRVWTSCFPC